MNDKKDSFSVFVSNEGTEISYLHKEAMNLDRFGPRQVRRASDVEFDHATQEWYAVLNNGVEIARHPSRDFVLAEERRVIESMKADGVEIPGCSQLDFDLAAGR